MSDRGKRFLAVINKHAATVTLALLLDLARALDLRLSVEVIADNEKEQGT